ncbi:MAG: hypothetical protein AAF525_15015 [Pseudomonadota bacterium]
MNILVCPLTPEISPVQFRVCLLLSLSLLLSCGGGGDSVNTGEPGGGGASANTERTVTGYASLGNISGANVSISGTDGVLSSGQTDANGRFQLTYPQNYTGPLEVVVSPTASSTWTCDILTGCFTDGTLAAFGDEIPFADDLRAVIVASGSNQNVTVSLLSHLGAVRSDVHGFTVAGVELANTEIADMINSALNLPSDLSLPSNFTDTLLIDLNNLSNQTGTPRQTVMSLINAVMLDFNVDRLPIEEYIEDLSNQIRAGVNLTVSFVDPTDISQEGLALVFFFLLDGYFELGEDGILNTQLGTHSAASLINATIDQLLALPTIGTDTTTFSFSFFEEDVLEDSDFAFNIYNTASPLDASTLFTEIDAGVFDVSLVQDGDQVIVQLATQPQWVVAQELGNQQIELRILDASRSLTPLFITLDVTVNVNGPVVAILPQFLDLRERDSAELVVDAVAPGGISSIQWTQTEGPPLELSGADTKILSFQAPELDEVSEFFQLTVTVTTPTDVIEQSIDFYVSFYFNIGTLEFFDPALRSCVETLAEDNNYTDLGWITALTCSGVSSTEGVFAMPNLRELTFTESSLYFLSNFLLDHPGLEFVDIRGDRSIPCTEFDLLPIEGVTVLHDDVCTSSQLFELPNDGHDIVHDDQRNQVYVSIPDESAIFVIDLESHETSTIDVPGDPRGIDLSPDSSILYIALEGHGTVGAIDLESNDFTEWDVATALGNDDTWDVLSTRQGTVYVVANPALGDAYLTALDPIENTSARIAGDLVVINDPSLYLAVDDHVFVRSGLNMDRIDKVRSTDDVLITQATIDSSLSRKGIGVLPDGSAIAVSNLEFGGQLIDADNLQPTEGQIGDFNATVPGDHRLFTAWTSPGATETNINLYVHFPGDDDTSVFVSGFGCPGFIIQNLEQLSVFKNGTSFSLLEDDQLCVQFPFSQTEGQSQVLE